jgi:hypothetical protein
MRRVAICVGPIIIAAITGVWLHAPEKLAASRPASLMGRLPLHFVPNRGQADPGIRYLANSAGLQLGFRDAGVDVADVRLRFEGRRAGARAAERMPLRGRVNYILRNDPRKWVLGVPTYSELVYRDLYPGIDVVYSGRGPSVESTFVVRPGARPEAVRVKCEGAAALSVDPAGNLLVEASTGRITQSKPRAFQVVRNSEREVAVRFKTDHLSYGFDVAGAYDPALPLYIDPILVFSSYLGGTGEDAVHAVAVDSGGQIYVTGYTDSTFFPAQSALQPYAPGGGDSFVTKISSDGSTLIYSTYLGGSMQDVSSAIAVDAAGSAYIAGQTFSTDFPLAAAFRNVNYGLGDAFVTKLSATGTLIYSTYLGGMAADIATGIAVDSNGYAYVAGQTYSITFPLQLSYQSSLKGYADAFVTKFSLAGNSLLYSTYLGGYGIDGANAIAIDSSGQAHVTGVTGSADFPLQNPMQSRLLGVNDAFVTKLSANGYTLIYSTYLGGSQDEAGDAIAVDPSGASVTGFTSSQDFPTTSAYQRSLEGVTDAFLTLLTPDGAPGAFSTYLGGSGQDEGTAVGRNANGDYFVAGITYSTDFPAVNALQFSLGGDSDAFVTQFVASGMVMPFSSYFGGQYADAALGMVLDSSGRLYVAGATSSSSDFPIKDAQQQFYGGGYSDGFYLRLDPTEITSLTTLYFPRLVTHQGSTAGSSDYTGIAVANLGKTNARLTFTAYDTTGRLITGSGITNPAVWPLAPGAQLASLDTEIFGSGLASRDTVGWFKLESTSAETAGFFLAFNGSLDVQDGADASFKTMTDFILPEVEAPPGFTQVFLANPGMSPATIGLELVGADGNAVATATRILGTSGVLAEHVTTLFPGAPITGDQYLRVTSNQGVVPFEFMGKTGQYVQGMNGQALSGGASTVYSPQYVIGGDWWTALSVVNLQNVRSSAIAKFVKEDGTPLGTKTIDLPPGGKVHITAQDFFVAPPSSGLLQGYVEITAAAVRVGGSVVFGDPARAAFSSALPLMSQGLNSAVFSQVASDPTYYTGLAVVNPSLVPAVALLQVFDDQGHLVKSGPVTIGAKSRSSKLLTQYFPDLPSMSAGYFTLKSESSLMSFAMFGTNSLSTLSAVPPQVGP